MAISTFAFLNYESEGQRFESFRARHSFQCQPNSPVWEIVRLRFRYHKDAVTRFAMAVPGLTRETFRRERQMVASTIPTGEPTTSE